MTLPYLAGVGTGALLRLFNAREFKTYLCCISTVLLLELNVNQIGVSLFSSQTMS